ncbi:MAG: hypothetical protein JSS20_10745 [Proteobacteria bacterium]|nr:hypothetical protein [Pseudomonadota bacterium]
MARLNTYDVSWYLDVDLCPCDVHFLKYLEHEALRDKAIFHFGTGEHHVVGRSTAENGSNNAVLGITASPKEHEKYVDLIVEQPEIGRTYKVLFGDIYQLDARLLPEFDIVSLFHVGEYRSEQNDAYGAMTDEDMVRFFVSRLKGPRLILLYSGSFAFDIAERIARKLVGEGLLEALGAFESLRIFRRRA